MHILAIILALLGGAAFWWWRVKMIHDAGSDVADAAGRAMGAWRRRKFRLKSDASAVDAVSDPMAAAVVMMIATARRDGELSGASEAAIRREIVETFGEPDATELFTFGKWVAGHVADANNVSLRYAKLWASSLNPDERRGLVTMVDRVAAADGRMSEPQRLAVAKLRERLGLG
jgi:uncharacterized tellurite resistance protein B-like protein